MAVVPDAITLNVLLSDCASTRCIEYCIYVNMYHVSVQGIDEHMINVHYYYYNVVMLPVQSKVCASVTW